MSSLAVNPVEAEWLEAVYKITATAKPTATNGTSGDENAQLKKKLEAQEGDLRKRLAAVKGLIPAALRGKLDSVAADLKADYKVSALEGRLKEIADQIGTLEKQPFTGDSPAWANEIRTSVSEFENSCKQVEGGLVKLAQQHAQELAQTETDPLRKKRLAAQAQESKIDFIAVPIERIATRFGQDLALGGAAKKNEIKAKYQKELQDTRADIEKVIAGDNFVAVVRREQKPREKKRDEEAMKTGAAEVEKKIAVLRELDADRGKQYEDRLKTADSLKKVNKIDHDIDGSIDRRKVDPTDIAITQKALGQKANAVEKAKKSKKGDEKAKLQDLENGLNGAKALAATGNKKVTEAAEKLAEQIAAAAADPNVGKVFATIESLKKELGDNHLKLFYPREQSSLLESLKKMGADLDPLDLEPSQTALAAASVKIKSLTDETAVRLEWQKATGQKLATMKYHFGQVVGEGVIFKGKINKTGIGYELKELGADYMAPDAVMKDVDKEVAGLAKRIDQLYRLKSASAEKGPREKLEKLLKADREEGDKRKEVRKARGRALAALRTRRQELRSVLNTQKSRVKGDPALEDEVALADELLKSAEQMGKSKQLEDATKKVDAAERKINRLTGKDVAAAGNTTRYLRDKAPTGWNNAVAPITEKIKEIKDAAVELAKKEGANADKVAKIIDDMTGAVFSPGLFKSSFQGPINQLLAAPDENQKKAAREKVLAEIGYLRKQLESNEVLMQLRLNPFKKAMSTTPIKAFLDVLELKTTQAVYGK